MIAECNENAGWEWHWTYDDAGNITSKTEINLETSEKYCYYYDYADQAWGDLLTFYDSRIFSYDANGNLTNDRIWEYTWQQGRQLASMTNGSKTWVFEYDANGMRIGRSNGTKTYSYLYTNGLLSRMILGDDTLCFAYDAVGAPLTVNYNGTTFYYVTNLQGDVIAILDRTGYPVVQYTYNAWGELLSATGPMLSSLGALNPLLYRGYVYDRETELYYLQSRYYDPVIGRFINLDAYVSTGQGILGNNMFTYCGNNPVNRTDCSGHAWYDNVWNWITSTADDVKDWVEDKVESVGEWAYQLYYNATKWHFEDRIDANGEHPAYSQVESDEEWSLLPRDQSLYHIDDVGKDELKFVHPDGREAVFNGDTLEPMLDSRYMATYNYVALMPLPDNPGMMDYIAYGVCWVGHGVTDVLPYWILGMCNTREDFEAKIIAKFE